MKYWIISILGALACSLLAGCSQSVTAPPTRAEGITGPELPGQLYFVSDGTLWVWEGTQARPIARPPEQAWRQPALGAQPAQLAWIVQGNSYSDLVIREQALTSNAGSAPPNSFERAYSSRWSFYPAWHPSGQFLVFCGQAGPPFGDPAAEYQLQLYQLRLDGSAPQPLTPDAPGQCGRSAFTPDGNRMITTRSRSGANGGQQLYEIDLTEGRSTPVVGAPVPSYDPSFSPDGAWLLFTARDDSGTDIFALSTQGNPIPQRITTVGSARAAALSPDQRLLAYLARDPRSGQFALWIAEVINLATLEIGDAVQLSGALPIDADSGISWR